MAREFKCPVCRIPTSTPYYRRPICHELDRVAEQKYPSKYAAKRGSYEEPPVVTERISSDVNLSEISRAARIALAFAVYKSVVPLLLDAARDAQSRFYIRNSETVRGAEKTLDLLSLLLFNHGVYRCAVTSTYEGRFLEVDFVPIPRDGPVNECINSEFSRGEGEEEEAEAAVVDPGMQEPADRLRSLGESVSGSGGPPRDSMMEMLTRRVHRSRRRRIMLPRLGRRGGRMETPMDSSSSDVV